MDANRCGWLAEGKVFQRGLPLIWRVNPSEPTQDGTRLQKSLRDASRRHETPRNDTTRRYETQRDATRRLETPPRRLRDASRSDVDANFHVFKQLLGSFWDPLGIIFRCCFWTPVLLCFFRKIFTNFRKMENVKSAQNHAPVHGFEGSPGLKKNAML